MYIAGTFASHIEKLVIGRNHDVVGMVPHRETLAADECQKPSCLVDSVSPERTRRSMTRHDVQKLPRRIQRRPMRLILTGIQSGHRTSVDRGHHRDHTAVCIKAIAGYERRLMV